MASFAWTSATIAGQTFYVPVNMKNGVPSQKNSRVSVFSLGKIGDHFPVTSESPKNSLFLGAGTRGDVSVNNGNLTFAPGSNPDTVATILQGVLEARAMANRGGLPADARNAGLEALDMSQVMADQAYALMWLLGKGAELKHNFSFSPAEQRSTLSLTYNENGDVVDTSKGVIDSIDEEAKRRLLASVKAYVQLGLVTKEELLATME